MGVIYAFPTGNSWRSLLSDLSLKLTWTGVEKSLRETSMQSIGIELARRVLIEAMEQEANELCGGEKGRHLKSKRKASRHGTKRSPVPFGAALVDIERPRIRANGKELTLQTYAAACSGQLSPSSVLAACAAGSSQRRFRNLAGNLQKTGERGDMHHLSKSTINRRFITAAEKVREELQTRPLGGEQYVAIYIDGTVEQGHHVLAALGLTVDGKKRVLGLREGSSESSAVCEEFLASLRARGLDVGERFLAILDGGKGLSAAVRAAFGSQAIIQRCRAHKLRNVLEKVPESERAALKANINKAWMDPNPKQAKRLLELIARGLEARGRKKAARSLREGLSDTLTCNFLGLPTDSDLTRTLVTTNPLESLFSTHAYTARWVKRWRNGRMLARWTATSLALAEQSFSSVDDKSGLQFLVEALAALAKRRAAA